MEQADRGYLLTLASTPKKMPLIRRFLFSGIHVLTRDALATWGYPGAIWCQAKQRGTDGFGVSGRCGSRLKPDYRSAVRC